ncbi:inositol monophosphatase family protein [Aliiruegeria lutimaris]|uniref:ADP-ribosylglycohydrolase n=1 Tax=Aliiruegeria lutimaris TaxID=571298 RepID=A0A1G9MFG9_9RHOB|nr:inositol monophosphatase family protein [Aliiruegeria lutimaris]SDL72843.1 ADP-ribosylglycohydrolase [Aliiruegeria lutimaris]
MIQNPQFTAPTFLLPFVEKAVRDAGALVRAEFHRPGGPRGFGGKAPIDADVDQLLNRRLLAMLAADWCSEETPCKIRDDRDAWLVDPLDGTADFVKGLRGSAISVALIRGGKPVLGVVYSPVAPDDRGDMFTWASGGQLMRNGVPVGLADHRKQIVVAMNADAADYEAQNRQTLGDVRVLCSPSPAYRLARAAAGEVDAALSLVPGLCPWDIAGGHALLIGAGGQLLQRNGADIDYRRTAFEGCIGGAHRAVAHLANCSFRMGGKQSRRPAKPRTRVETSITLSRAQGCLLGQLSGDALGSAVEFLDRGTIARLYPRGVIELADGGTWNTIAGQPTDDSEMALALARSLAGRGHFDESDVARAYVRWKSSGPFDIGHTTAVGISALANGSRGATNSQANGALMRVSPIGIFAAGQPKEAARLAAQDARLTHPHPVCQAANSAFAAAISAGVAGGSCDEMWSTAYAYAGRGRGAAAVKQRLMEARSGTPADFQHQMGWVLTAFQNAFHYLINGVSLVDALVETVSKGGDTDTNAAICGALLGAVEGRDGIPRQWRNAVLTCRPVPSDDVHHPRPSVFWPDDALDLSEALLVSRQRKRTC